MNILKKILFSITVLVELAILISTALRTDNIKDIVFTSTVVIISTIWLKAFFDWSD